MPDAAPAAPAVLNRDLQSGPRIVMVANPGDDHRMVRRLAVVEGPGRLVVRPTPGGRVSDLALDILTATGRSPSVLLADHIPTSDTWAQAAAQLTADQTRHVVVDRAHRLPGDALGLLAELGHRAGATVWLIWPTTEDNTYVPAPLRAFRDAGYRLHAIDFRAFMRELPPPPRVLTGGLRADAKTPWAEGTGPALPMQDFLVFLVHCREKLPGNTFTAVRAVYDREVHLADQWLTRRGLTGHHIPAQAARGTPAPSPPASPSTSETTESAPPPTRPTLSRGCAASRPPCSSAATCCAGSTRPSAPGPTTRPLSQLTARVCDKLRAAAIEDAAATALSIHLSHGPTGLGLITCGNTAPDGHTIHLPVTGSPYISEETRFLTVPWKWRSHRHRPIELSALDVLHLESDDPVRLPAHRRPPRLPPPARRYRLRPAVRPPRQPRRQKPRTRPTRSGPPHLPPHPPQPGVAPPIPLPPRRRGPARRPAGRMDAPPRPRLIPLSDHVRSRL